MRRAEIWTAASGSDYAGKPRPVLIVQDDHFSDIESITICPFTTNPLSPQLYRVAVEPTETNGLLQASWLMADKLATMHRNKLGRRIGRLDDATMLRLNRAITVSLGIAG